MRQLVYKVFIILNIKWHFFCNNIYIYVDLFKTQFCFVNTSAQKQKKVILFPEIGRVTSFLWLTRPHSRMCIKIKQKTVIQKKTKNKQKDRTRRQIKAKETKQEQQLRKI